VHKLILRAGNLEAGLAPDVGGSITHLSARTSNATLHLLRPAPESFDEVRKAGCYPLVPFSNRLRNGCFEMRGRRICLPPNIAGQKHPLHGMGWRRPWFVSEHCSEHAELVFRHAPSEWPWEFEARQRFELDESALSITLSVRNLSADPMPAGLGLHPYFLCDRRTTLDAKTHSVWLTDDELIPTSCERVRGRYALRRRPMLDQSLDNGYQGWNGEALVDWGHAGLRILARSTQYFQVFSPRPGAGLYAPAGWGVFAAEPVTHMNAALNRPHAQWQQAGLSILQPGEQTALDVRFEVLQ
jgi:aldose 1-epimerase